MIEQVKNIKLYESVQNELEKLVIQIKEEQIKFTDAWEIYNLIVNGVHGIGA